ncbi:MAG: hypothetical protein IKY90_08200, partial [Oscillospiraceae bacterium]|nr:hypothetical protein [Oscillospiraceae bacterium]
YKHKLFLRCAGVTFGAKVTKTWGVTYRPTPLASHKCGMLRLLQITEFSPRSLHSLAKEFCRDFRKNISTC